jgi:hypothetical protein
MTDIVKRLGLFDGSDIVERLRSGEDGLEYAAADEIERLRAELDEAIERGNDWCDQAKKARAERDAAIMDADMQAREAGNMEHNARVLMAERDLLRDVVRAFLKADDHWLRGNKDNEWASMMASARAMAHSALKETGHG